MKNLITATIIIISLLTISCTKAHDADTPICLNVLRTVIDRRACESVHRAIITFYYGLNNISVSANHKEEIVAGSSISGSEGLYSYSCSVQIT